MSAITAPPTPMLATCNTRSLIQAIRIALPAVDGDRGRYSLNQIHWRFSGGTLTIEATDSRTAHLVTLPYVSTDVDDVEFLMNVDDARKMIAKSPGDDDGSITLEVFYEHGEDDPSYRVSVERKRYKGGFIGHQFTGHAGRFPKIADVIPDDVGTATLSGTADALIEFLTPNPRHTLTISGNKATLSTNDENLGNVRCEGASTQLINTKHALQFLLTLKPKTAVVLSTYETLAVIRPTFPSNESAVCVFMKIVVQD